MQLPWGPGSRDSTSGHCLQTRPLSHSGSARGPSGSSPRTRGCTCRRPSARGGHESKALGKRRAQETDGRARETDGRARETDGRARDRARRARGTHEGRSRTHAKRRGEPPGRAGRAGTGWGRGRCSSASSSCRGPAQPVKVPPHPLSLSRTSRSARRIRAGPQTGDERRAADRGRGPGRRPGTCRCMSPHLPTLATCDGAQRLARRVRSRAV
jgi:hypothetical protein